MAGKTVRAIEKTDLLLAVLALVSFIVLCLPQNWMTRQTTLDLSTHAATVYGDDAIGGNSHGQFHRESKNEWLCELRPGFADPFCSYQINLIGSDGKGMDLSKYQNLTIDLGYEGPARNVRVYLRSRKPEYYVTGDINTTKYNGVELDAQSLSDGPYTVSLGDFSVADWWITSQGIPPHLSHPDFDDVLFIEIQTGANAAFGEYRYDLKSIGWNGPIIAQKLMYQGLLAVWVVMIVLLLLYRVVQLKLALNRKAKYQRQLLNINKLLNVQNQQIEELAKTDTLTGINNRLGVRQCFYDGLTDWLSNEQPLSMILLDIDNFKRVNDQYGHDVGDTVLREIATTLINSVRSTDVVARWGGEEFMVICPDTDLAQARIVAENLRARIASAEIASAPAVTASFGVASLASDDLDYLFKQADEALYAAKAAGKNRVISAHPPELVEPDSK